MKKQIKLIAAVLAAITLFTGCTSADTASTSTQTQSSTPAVSDSLEEVEDVDHFVAEDAAEVEEEVPIPIGESRMEATSGNGVLDLGEDSPLTLGAMDRVRDDAITDLATFDMGEYIDAWDTEKFYRNTYVVPHPEEVVSPIADVVDAYIFTTIFFGAMLSENPADSPYPEAYEALVDLIPTDGSEINEDILQQMLAIEGTSENFAVMKEVLNPKDSFTLSEMVTSTVTKEEDEWVVESRLLTFDFMGQVANAVLSTLHCPCGATYEVVSAQLDVEAEHMSLEEVAEILINNFEQ